MNARCRRAMAVGSLAAVIAGMAIYAVVNQRINLLTKIPMDNPPEVLLAKAREISQKLGYISAPVSSSYGFDYRYGTIRIMRLNQATRRIRLPAGRRR